MRVVHVGKFYPPEYRGGLESVVVGINDELVRRGVEVTVVVAALHGKSREEDYRGARVVRVPAIATVLSQPLSPTFGRAVHEATGDLLHLHHPNPLGDAAVLGDARPLVITHHSDIVRQRALRLLYGPLQRRVRDKARAIAIGSEQLLRSSEEMRGYHAKARVIPFGIDAERFAATALVKARVTQLRQAWGERPAILGVGRLVGYKGFDVLIDAARGLDAVVVLVGTGPEEARLRALAGPSVVFSGHVDDAELVAHYHAAEIFCLPSVTPAEAFGMVLLEAMACGKPLVSTALPTGVSAVNRDGQTGLIVPPRDMGALREALSALLQDRPRRHAMGEAAQRVQREEYSAELMGERYVKLYEEALS